MESPINKLLPHLQIPLEDVLKATNNFHHDNIIGLGDFGPAYKGQLFWSGKLMKVVARRLDRRRGLGRSEFWGKEVSMLSHLKHTNLVSMIGFCDEKGEKIIVNTYEANGSLRQFVNSPNLTWMQRLRICVGIARALNYLHSDEGRGYSVIHRFINTSTVLLDENWEAKLSGFEISIQQLGQRKELERVILCEPIGKREYTDPAVGKTKGVTHKSDIYSFGVVLFEILCGEKAFSRNESRRRFLAPVIKYHYESKTLKDIIHPDIWNQMSGQSLIKYSEVAFSCLNEERARRPDMNYIVDKLEEVLEFELRLQNLGKNLNHLKIRLSDIISATNDFSEPYRIGVTGLCTLYRARLDHFYKDDPSFVVGKSNSEPSIVVIKRILPRDDKDGEEFFFTEFEKLTSIKHHGIVSLLGFCVEGCDMILVIENVSNGYLADYLENVNKMRNFKWEKRLKICIEVAHALNYVHYQLEGQNMLIHRDIKSQNIGFDENWGAKIVDFGLSLSLPQNTEDNALYPNKIAGTKAYWDPEYEKTGKLKRESDVYSFGVVLFEILCGRLAYDPIYLNECEKGLAPVVRRRFCSGTLADLIDPLLKVESIENNFFPNRGPNKDSLETFIKIAYKCVVETQVQRPTMQDVVKELEKALVIQEKSLRRHNIDKVPGFEPTHANVAEEGNQGIQHPTTYRVIDKIEKPSESSLTHEIFRDNLEHLMKIPLNDIYKTSHESFFKDI